MPDWLYIVVLVLATMSLLSVVLLALAGRIPVEPDICACGHDFDAHMAGRYSSPCDCCECTDFVPIHIDPEDDLE